MAEKSQVTIWGKTYTRPENAQAGWLAEARKADGSIKPTTPITNNVNTSATPAPIAQPTAAINKESPAYAELTAKWYTDTDIIEGASRVINQKQPEVTAPVNVSVEQKKLEEQQAADLTKINQQTGLAEWAKLETTKEVATKLPDYQDESVERLTEIQWNLEQYAKLAPQNFSDYETFKKSFDYNNRSQKQKDVLDSFWENKQQLSQPDFWAGMSDDDIVNGVISNKITNQDMTDLFNTNPERYGIIKEKIEKNSLYDNANNSLSDTLSSTIKDLWLDVAEREEDWLLKRYEQFMDTEEIKSLESSLSEQQWAIELIDEKLFNMKDTIISQYAWKGMSADVLDAIIADRSEALNKQKRTSVINYNTDLNKYNSLMSDAQKKLDTITQQETIKSQDLQNKMQTLWFAYNLYKDSPEYITERYNLQYNLENPDMNSADIYTSKRWLNMALDQYYKDFWAIILRPQAQVVADVLNLAKTQWISVAEALKKNFVEPLQSKDMYGQLLQKSLWIWVEVGWYNMKQWADWNWNVTAPSKIVDLLWFTAWGDLSNSEWVSLYPKEASFKNNNPTWVTWWATSEALKQMRSDAGIQFEKWTARPSSEWGNYVKFATIEDGMKAYQIALTQRWDDVYSRLKQWVWTSNWDNYATQIMNEAWITKWTKFSELSPEQTNKIMMAQLKRESSGMYKYLTTQWNWWNAWYDTNLERVFEAMSQNKGKIDATTQEALQEMWIDAKDLWWQYNSWKKTLEKEITPHAESLLRNIDQLKNIDKDQYNSMTLNIPRTEWAWLRAQLDQMKSSVALQKLIELKSQWATFGALSNQELQFIERASWGELFSTRLSYADWKKNIDEFDRILRKLETTAWQDNTVFNNIQNQTNTSIWMGSQQWYFDYWTLFTLTNQ